MDVVPSLQRQRVCVARPPTAEAEEADELRERMITLREISPRFRQWNTSPDFDHERVVQACLAWCHDEGRARLEHRPVLLQLSTMSPRWAEGARLN